MTVASSDLGPALPRAYDVPLLRLRLRLALLTMAILPTTLAMALAYSTLNGQAVGETVRLADRTDIASRTIGAQLERASTALAVLAADPTLTAALENPLAGQPVLAAQLARPLDGVLRVILLDTAGHATFSHALGPGAGPVSTPADELALVLRMPAGGVHLATVATADGALLLSTPLVPPTGGAAVGALRFEMAARDLLSNAQREAGAKPGGPAEHSNIYLISADGTLLSSALGTAAAAPSSAELAASLAAEPANVGQWSIGDSWRAGTANLGSSFAGLRVVVLDEATPPQLPLALFGLLAALTALLVGITVWMSRQVIVPAQELARSREQLLGMYEAARADALRDALTGLGNHRAFQEELEHQLEWYRRYKVPFALMLIDLDDLKIVNDSAGHSAGDEVLRTMGRLIAEIARYADRTFRIGGDEFAILLPHTTADGALELGRRLLATATNNDAPIPFSAGVSACPDLATSRDQLYTQADAALYWCKRHGRASLDAYHPLRDEPADQAAAGSHSAQIARVVSHGQLRAAYQPVVDLRSGLVIGFEGLTRPQPESGFADPGQLFAAAEAAGRTVELDYACLENVIGQAHGLGPDQLLSVNLSPRTVEAPQFSAEWLVGILADKGMDPRRVVIELTEQQGIEDLPQVQRNLAALQRAGIRVAVDDVGAGNAGLRLLSQFRFDIVKIDLSLVQDGTRRDSSRAVLTSLRELAGRWGAYVVAEGIETVSQLRVVREMQLAAGQGYLLGRPMPAPRLARVDLAALEAGGVVMQARLNAADVAAPRPATS